LEEAIDFDSKREFLQKHIEQVTFTSGDVIVAGFVPIRLKAYENPDQSSELSKIGFKLQGKVRLGMKKS
jgi:hypothetical protein